MRKPGQEFQPGKTQNTSLSQPKKLMPGKLDSNTQIVLDRDDQDSARQSYE